MRENPRDDYVDDHDDETCYMSFNFVVASDLSLFLNEIKYRLYPVEPVEINRLTIIRWITNAR